MSNSELVMRIVSTLGEPFAEIENLKEDGKTGVQLTHSDAYNKIANICTVISSIVGGEFVYRLSSNTFEHEYKNEYGIIWQTIAIDKVYSYICNVLKSML